MNARLLLLFLAVGSVAVPASARAGALAKVVDGLKKQSGQDDDSSDSGRTSEPKSSDADREVDSGDWDSGGSDEGGSYGGGSQLVVVAPTYATPYGPDADVSIYLGLTRVDDSDGAGIATVRASYGDFGLSVGDSAYFEQTTGERGSDVLELHVWSIAGNYRAVSADQTNVWITGGLSGANSDGLNLFGAALGAEVEHHLTGSLGAEASVRGLAFQDQIRGLELRAAVAASVLRFGYRILKFNVGPALQGPEVGIALRF